MPRRFDSAHLLGLVLLAAVVAAPVRCRTVPNFITTSSIISSSSETHQQQQQQVEGPHPPGFDSRHEFESESEANVGVYPPPAREPKLEGVVEHQISLSRRALLQSTTYPIEVKHQPGLSYRVSAAASRKKKKLEKEKKKNQKGRKGSGKDGRGGKKHKAPKSNKPSKARGGKQPSGSPGAAGKARPSSNIFLSLPTDDVEIEGDEDEGDEDEEDTRANRRKSRASQTGAPSFNGADAADLSSSEGIQVISPNATDSSGGEDWGIRSSNTILTALGVATFITVCCFCICSKLCCGGTPDEGSGSSYMLRKESLLARAYLNYSLPSTTPADHSGHKKKCSKSGQHTKKKKKHHHHKHHNHKEHSGKNKHVDPHKRLVAIEEQDIVPNHDDEIKSVMDGGGVDGDHEVQTVDVEVEATLDMNGEVEKDSKSQPPV